MKKLIYCSARFWAGFLVIAMLLMSSLAQMGCRSTKLNKSSAKTIVDSVVLHDSSALKVVKSDSSGSKTTASTDNKKASESNKLAFHATFIPVIGKPTTPFTIKLNADSSITFDPGNNTVQDFQLDKTQDKSHSNRSSTKTKDTSHVQKSDFSALKSKTDIHLQGQKEVTTKIKEASGVSVGELVLWAVIIVILAVIVIWVRSHAAKLKAEVQKGEAIIKKL